MIVADREIPPAFKYAGFCAEICNRVFSCLFLSNCFFRRESEMKKHWMTGWIGVVCLLVFPAIALAGGFQINEQGTKATAMGGAFVATADDPSAVYFNPAGIVQLDGMQFDAGLAVIYIPDVKMQSSGTSAFARPGQVFDAESQTHYVPHFYTTYKLNDMWSFGFGTFSNYGLKTEWPLDWEGRYITGGTKARVTTISINPVVAFRPIKRLSISAGPVAQYLDIDLQNQVFMGPGFSDAHSKMTGDDWDWGFNAGLLFWITDDLKFGASYRSKVKHSITGGEFRLTETPFGLYDMTDSVDADLDLPAITYLGLAYDRGPLTLEFDAQWTQWSSYDKLEATFTKLPTLSVPKEWDDVWAYRFGVNFRINEAFDLRAGITYDTTPIPDNTLDPLVPSGDRWLYSLGFGYHSGGLKIDFAYTYLSDEERSFDNDVGDYDAAIAPGLGNVTGEFQDVYAHIFVVNLSYAF